MAYPAYVRAKARALRVKRHLSIDEIAERLALPKTTIYSWVSDIPLNRARRETNVAANRAMRRKYRILREEAQLRGRREFVQLADDPTFRDFVCLYIAEGAKRNRNAVRIGNSDPRLIVLANRWIKSFTSRAIRYSVQYHADRISTRCRDSGPRPWTSAWKTSGFSANQTAASSVVVAGDRPMVS